MNRATLVVVSVLGVAVGCQPLERTRGFGEGELRLRVVDDGAGVGGAVVEVIGSPRQARTGEDGRAVVTDLVPGDQAVRVVVDDDGDLVPDRGALRADAAIREAVVAGRPRLTTFDLGDVILEPLGTLTGSVTGVQDGELARVVVVRRVLLGASPETAREVLLPVEGAAGVATDGAFTIGGLVQGPVTLVAMAWPKATSTAPLQQVIAASRPVRFGVVDVDVGDAAVALDVTTAVPASVATTIELAGDLAAERNSGLATFAVPTSSTEVIVGLNAPFDGLSSPAALVADVPLSVFDLQVQLDSGVLGRVALVTALPDSTVLPVPVGLTACPLIDDAPDCDGDGVTAATDLDDDGDTVDDALEPSACVGVGVGVDDDGDCLCGLADPFPGCATNDPVDCVPAAPITCE